DRNDRSGRNCRSWGEAGAVGDSGNRRLRARIIQEVDRDRPDIHTKILKARLGTEVDVSGRNAEGVSGAVFQYLALIIDGEFAAAVDDVEIDWRVGHGTAVAVHDLGDQELWNRLTHCADQIVAGD